MEQKCSYCKKEFSGQRSTSKFCCAKCRVYFNRKKEFKIEPKKEIEQKPDKPKWSLRERPKPPEGLTGLALRVWKDKHGY